MNVSYIDEIELPIFTGNLCYASQVTESILYKSILYSTYVCTTGET